MLLQLRASAQRLSVQLKKLGKQWWVRLHTRLFLFDTVLLTVVALGWGVVVDLGLLRLPLSQIVALRVYYTLESSFTAGTWAWVRDELLGKVRRELRDHAAPYSQPEPSLTWRQWFVKQVKAIVILSLLRPAPYILALVIAGESTRHIVTTAVVVLGVSLAQTVVKGAVLDFSRWLVNLAPNGGED